MLKRRRARCLLVLIHAFAFVALASADAYAEAVSASGGLTLEGLGILAALVASVAGVAATWGRWSGKWREHDEAISSMRRTLYGPSGEPEQGLVVRLVRVLDRLERAEADHERRTGA